MNYGGRPLLSSNSIRYSNVSKKEKETSEWTPLLPQQHSKLGEYLKESLYITIICINNNYFRII